ncbi:hypothetical protein COO60DRAFT_1000751 [Scenedesmus sp. NREL 46B-D3]|nr:hypothetical protein COO60DRAFT_1000751 [Scenedesmus sp. NREL 46B-D3]
MDAADDNEGACGACKRVGELICCEGCPAAFHCRCAGYESAEEVPEGDWYCWFCAKERKVPYQHPRTVFKPPRASNCAVMLASHDTAEVFFRCRPVDVSESYVELKYLDVQHDDEVVHRSSTRLWHGTTDKHAWSLVSAGAYRPNCRLFQVDKAAAAAEAAARRTSKQQRRQHRASTRQPSLGGAPAAAAAAVRRIPAGEVGAGLPVVDGGASKEEFEAALHSLWRSLLGPGYPERMPATQPMGGEAVEPWLLWREVWAWGGADCVSRNKLWATVGFAFNASIACTSISSRIKKSYDILIQPLDQAIDVGDISLQRPICSRKITDRALQLRSCPGSKTNGGAAAATPTRAPSQQRTAPDRPRGSGRRSRVAARRGSCKRKRGAWSSDDDEEPAPDMGSEFEFESEDEAGADDDADGMLGFDVSGDESSGEDGSAEGSEGGSPCRKKARTVASMRTASAAAGAAQPAAAAAERREPPGVKMAVGKPILTPAAQQLRVGQLVDFRQWQQDLGCAAGWRSGTVLAVEPGSVWEGGSRLLVQPRHSHPSSEHGRPSSSHHPHPVLSPAAAAALAAVAALGGPAGSEAGAASKLLTSRGHLRHEVAGLMQQQVPVRPGSTELSGANMRTAAHSTCAVASPGAQRQHQESPAAAPQAAAAAAAAPAGRAAACGAPDVKQHQAGNSRPAWVPLLYRGSPQQPLQQPLVMVRPHYVPSASAAAAASAAAGTSARAPGLQEAANGGALPFSPQPQAQQSGQHVFSLQLSPNMLVEALHQGCWWPAKVVEVKPASRQDKQQQQQQQQQAAASAGHEPGGSCSREPCGLVSCGGGGGCGGCVVLRNLEPPDADGLVWRCSLGHAMRPCHPQHAAGMGVLAAEQGDVLPLSQLRKQVAPYTYAVGIQAFACLSHLLDSRPG